MLVVQWDAGRVMGDGGWLQEGGELPADCPLRYPPRELRHEALGEISKVFLSSTRSNGRGRWRAALCGACGGTMGRIPRRRCCQQRTPAEAWMAALLIILTSVILTLGIHVEGTPTRTLGDILLFSSCYSGTCAFIVFLPIKYLSYQRTW